MADRRSAQAAPRSPRAAQATASALDGPEQTLSPLALTLHQAAALVGAYRWVEERLFALTGRWSADPAMGPDAQVHLFEVSAQHAWHADLWAQRLPVLDGFDRTAATRPRGPVLEPLVSALADEPAAAGRLAGLARVLVPELAAAYRHHLVRAVPVTDGPLIRTLHLVLADLDVEERALERVLDRAGPGRSEEGPTAGGPAESADSAEAVEAVVGRLEAVLRAVGDPENPAADSTVPGAGSAGPLRPVRLVPWPGEER